MEFPDLELNLHQPYKDRGVVVVGVNPDPKLLGGETPATLQLFAEQTQITFPIGLDPSKSYRSFPQNGSISPFPLDVVVDAEGKIAYISRTYNARALTSVIESLLAKK